MSSPYVLAGIAWTERARRGLRIAYALRRGFRLLGVLELLVDPGFRPTR